MLYYPQPTAHCSLKPGSKLWTEVQVNFCLHSPRLENMQVIFSYSYTWNTSSTQQITQQRAAPMYLLPAQEIKWGLEWRTKRIHAPPIHKTGFLTTVLAPLGPDKFMMWQFLGLHVNVYLCRSMCPNIIQKQLLQPTFPQAGGQVTIRASISSLLQYLINENYSLAIWECRSFSKLT